MLPRVFVTIKHLSDSQGEDASWLLTCRFPCFNQLITQQSGH